MWHSSVNTAPYLSLSVYDDVWSDVSEETSKQTALTLTDSKTSIHQTEQSYFSDNVVKSIYESLYDNCRYVVNLR